MSSLNGEDLKRRRGELGLTQAALAEIVDMHVRTVSKWERGINAVPEWVGLVLYGIELQQRLASQPKKKRRAGQPGPGGAATREGEG